MRLYYNECVNLNLENLNPEQKLAVSTTQGPLLVLSGAGTGKTRVLTTRVAYILNSGLAMPWQVLALTFTNRAANEMKTRIAEFADGDVAWQPSDLWCGTFHSICLRILRANASLVGLRRDFLIYGEDDQKNALKNVFANLGLDAADYKPSDWIERISAIKDKGLVRNGDGVLGAVAKKILDAYNAELARLGAVDFGDIILHVLRLFDKNPDVLARYTRQFKYIMVDEFQDTNRAQMQFLEMLTRDNDAPNICCVGDDDQSIYSWRGAEIKNILGFEQKFKNAQIIRLETNYRSTPNILGAANSLIRHNRGRLGKDLRTATGATSGEPVYVLTLPSDWDEVRIISDTIMHSANGVYSDFAVLIRAGSLSRLLEEEFTSRGIPYRLVGATKFYDRAEIRDAIAYLRLMVYPFDDMSFMRIIGKPRRGFGPSALQKLRATGDNFMSGMHNAKLTGKMAATRDEFLAAFDFDWAGMPPVDAAQKLLNDAGYIRFWHESKDADKKDRLDNIRELITNVIAKYDTLPEFLEHAALMTADDNDADASVTNAVSIMTIHAAKGLEFNTVFLPAWEEGIFPNDMSVTDGGLEEERRLAYVAITRARQRAIISNAMSRMVFGTRQYNSPSRFITEMDNRFLDFQGGGPRTLRSAPQPQKYTPRPATIKNKNIVGRLVEHSEMGRGVVIEDAGDILTVAFRRTGIKKVARGYLTVVD